MSLEWAAAINALCEYEFKIIKNSIELESDVDVIVKSLRIKGFDCDYDVKEVCNCSRETSAKSICCYDKKYKIKINGEVFDIETKRQLDKLIDALKIGKGIYSLAHH